MKCKVEKICGGCCNLCWNQAKQAEFKKKQVEEIMERAGIQAKVQNVHMAKHDSAYRNKVIVGFAKDKDKKVYSGLYVIGDCSGVTHSLSHASASGVYVGRIICKDF